MGGDAMWETVGDEIVRMLDMMVVEQTLLKEEVWKSLMINRG
jgi:hypothetical protein